MVAAGAVSSAVAGPLETIFPAAANACWGAPRPSAGHVSLHLWNEDGLRDDLEHSTRIDDIEREFGDDGSPFARVVAHVGGGRDGGSRSGVFDCRADGEAVVCEPIVRPVDAAAPAGAARLRLRPVAEGTAVDADGEAIEVFDAAALRGPARRPTGVRVTIAPAGAPIRLVRLPAAACAAREAAFAPVTRARGGPSLLSRMLEVQRRVEAAGTMFSGGGRVCLKGRIGDASVHLVGDPTGDHFVTIRELGLVLVRRIGGRTARSPLNCDFRTYDWRCEWGGDDLDGRVMESDRPDVATLTRRRGGARLAGLACLGRRCRANETVAPYDAAATADLAWVDARTCPAPEAD